MNKEKLLNNINIQELYQSFVPSLKTNGKPEATGLCPFHEDRNPSFSVNIETGLFRCFSCNAKGDTFTFYQKIKKVDFKTAFTELEKMTGISDTEVKPKVVASFQYTDEAGQMLYTKERLEPGRYGRSKEFVFKHQENGEMYSKWVKGRGCDAMLYNLPQVSKSKYCIIVEGEAKANFLTGWGLTATCLDSGANSKIRDEYIEILSNLEKVVILPDADSPGRSYATRIANALYGKIGELKVVELPGLGEAEDILDWSQIHGNNKEKLLEITKNTNIFTPRVDLVDVVDFSQEEKNNFNDAELFPPQPFPFEILPEKLSLVCDNFADALHVEKELIACSMLPILSSVIGNSIRVSPKGGYDVALFIWLLIIADTGYGKSPVLNTLIKPLEHLQGQYYGEYQAQLRKYNLNLKIAKQKKSVETLEPPKLRQTYVQDTTVEALADVYEGNSRGILLCLDEIAALVLGFSQYKQVKGGNDREHYLSLFNASPLKINRKTNIRFIPNTGLAIYGGIQPKVMPKIFDCECFDNGLSSRFVSLNLKNKPTKFSLAEVKGEYTDYWGRLINACLEIPLEINDMGFAVPQKITLSEGAREAYIEHYNQYMNTAELLSDQGKVFIPKLLIYCLKFVGILHVLSSLKVPTQHKIYPSSINPIKLTDTVPLETMKNAIMLTQFFTGQAMKTLSLYGTSKNKFNEYQKRVIKVLHELQGVVSGGRLQLGQIVDAFNKNLPDRLQLSNKKISHILKELELKTKEGTAGYYFLIWEWDKIENLFKEMSTTSTKSTTTTNITPNEEDKVEEVEEVEEVEVDSKENNFPLKQDVEVLEIEFIEEIKNV